MKKLIAVMALGAVVLGSVAMARSASLSAIDEAQVQSKIDSRLHDLLVKSRMERAHRF